MRAFDGLINLLLQHQDGTLINATLYAVFRDRLMAIPAQQKTAAPGHLLGAQRRALGMPESIRPADTFGR